MTEYWITLTFEVDAVDIEQATEIAKDLMAQAKQGLWKIKHAEITDVEEA